ncbi:hypothetical protein T484DRAFT_2433120 [Baffinella frigidus]|nr:hypothetical protein T484DRAFT_2433120 [Cryptophyta sp. CCMP2293]
MLVMAIKAVTLLFVARALPHRRVTQMMSCAEALSSLYRDLLPIPLWYAYLADWPSGNLLPGLVRGCYLTFKLIAVLNRIGHLRSSLASLASHSSPYGSYVGIAEMEEEGRRLASGGEAGEEVACTICHDGFARPVRLSCGHTFCEDCVAEWLQREQTCPLCRAVVRTPTHHHAAGDGTTSLLPVVF